ncbi:hypothetical protein D3C75_1101320 [compost metagenome]
MILDKPLQADSHFRKLGIVLRLDFGLIIQIGYKKAEKAAHDDHGAKQQAHSNIQ